MRFLLKTFEEHFYPWLTPSQLACRMYYVEGNPDAPFVRALTDKTQKQVVRAIGSVASAIESLRILGVMLGQSIRKIQSDKGTDFSIGVN
eukprot:3331660-Amphidinium_carterae.1